VNGQTVLRNSHNFLTNKTGRPEEDQASWSRHFKIIWVSGMLVMLPSDMIKLPLNMNLMDIWILMGLPFFWLAFFRKKQIVNLTYMIPMWLIFLGSLASVMVAAVPTNGLIVILKEVYIFIWFITITAVLSKIHPRDFRHLLTIWSGIVLLHGIVIIVQFFSHDFFRFTVSLVGETKEFELYRPSGLFLNPNKAAFFQLLGFVPVMLANPSKKVKMILGLFLLLTILATGSVGSTTAFLAGLLVAAAVISIMGHFDVILRLFVKLSIIVAIIGGSLFIIGNQNNRYQTHFEHILLGRIDRSSEGRIGMWKQAIDAFADHGVFLWGIGPENFREVGDRDKQLHNDIFAFTMERGLIATLGLVLFAIAAAGRAVYMVLINNRQQDPDRLIIVVFLAAITAGLVVSLTHQIFHFRELWVVLAFQEAILFQMKASESDLKPITHTFSDQSRHLRGFAEQPDVASG
jgi:O-antigen ligase